MIICAFVLIIYSNAILGVTRAEGCQSLPTLHSCHRNATGIGDFYTSRDLETTILVSLICNGNAEFIFYFSLQISITINNDKFWRVHTDTGRLSQHLSLHITCSLGRGVAGAGARLQLSAAAGQCQGSCVRTQKSSAGQQKRCLNHTLTAPRPPARPTEPRHWQVTQTCWPCLSRLLGCTIDTQRRRLL